MISVTPYNYRNSYTYFKQNSDCKNNVLDTALEELKNVEFNADDFAYIKKLGSRPPFNSGKEAYDFIKKSNLNIKFAKLSSNDIHAQWDNDTKSIRINEIYKNTKNKAVVLAIAEAIMHEAGHAKDMDGDSSIQEELNCLALNALAHRTLDKKYPDVYTTSDENIVKKGVILYADIYFDPNLSRLVKKIKKSYLHLPAGDVLHPANNLALAIKYHNH